MGQWRRRVEEGGTIRARPTMGGTPHGVAGRGEARGHEQADGRARIACRISSTLWELVPFVPRRGCAVRRC